MNTPNHPVRDNLIGYLLDAVEPDERAAIDHQLQSDPQLCEQLEVLRRSLHPLAHDKDHHTAPVGLARRCCDFIKSRTEIMPAALSPVRGTAAVTLERRRWSWLDVSLASAIALAITIVLLPAIYQSHAESQLLACQKNLQDIGGALANYSEHNASFYPDAQRDDHLHNDRLKVAGMGFPILVTQKYLPQGKYAVCPASKYAGDPKYHVPTVDELDSMNSTQLAEWLPKLAGGYGYTLGYKSDGVYKTQKNTHRHFFVVVADASNEDGTGSPNHGPRALNILLDDG